MHAPERLSERSASGNPEGVRRRSGKCSRVDQGLGRGSGRGPEGVRKGSGRILVGIVADPFQTPSDPFQTPFRPLSDPFQTPFRPPEPLSDPFQTPFRPLSDPFQTPFRPLSDRPIFEVHPACQKVPVSPHESLAPRPGVQGGCAAALSVFSSGLDLSKVLNPERPKKNQTKNRLNPRDTCEIGLERERELQGFSGSVCSLMLGLSP